MSTLLVIAAAGCVIAAALNGGRARIALLLCSLALLGTWLAVR